MSEYLKMMHSAMQCDIMFDEFNHPRLYWIRFLFKAHKAGY